MGELNLVQVAVGAVALLAGVTMLVRAIRGRPGEDPKSTAMLIGGMMATAFGLALAGFAIAYATGENSP
jgi:hypothetical protein